MTLSDLHCDICDVSLSGLVDRTGEMSLAGVRFSYHPGDPRMRDDSGVVCAGCWQDWTGPLGRAEVRRCATCGAAVRRTGSLHLRRMDTAGNGWQLCPPHAAHVLNALRTVQPKFDPATFRLPLDRPASSEDRQ